MDVMAGFARHRALMRLMRIGIVGRGLCSDLVVGAVATHAHRRIGRLGGRGLLMT